MTQPGTQQLGAEVDAAGGYLVLTLRELCARVGRPVNQHGAISAGVDLRLEGLDSEMHGYLPTSQVTVRRARDRHQPETSHRPRTTPADPWTSPTEPQTANASSPGGHSEAHTPVAGGLRFFLSTDRGSGEDYVEGLEGIRVRDTPEYIEYVEPVGDFFSTTYWLKVAPAAYFVVTSWDDEFSFPLHMLSDPKVGPGVAKSALEAWPTFMGLVANSAQPHPRFSEGVIAHIQDPDSAEMKWVIGSFLGNHPIDRPEQLATERSRAVFECVFTLSGQIGSELSGTPVANLPNLGDNVYYSVKQAERERLVRYVKQYAPKVIELSLSSLVGGFLSDS